MLAVEILAYISVGIITLGWLLSLIYDFVKNIHTKKETENNQPYE